VKLGPLIGQRLGESELPIESPMKVTAEANSRLGGLIVFSSMGEPAESPRASR
jgi:hypothetical protein